MTIKQTALEVWKLANSRDHNDPLFIAALAALRREREPVKVKPLVWECFDAWTYWAFCVVGTYRVQERNGVWKAILDDTNLIYEYTTDSLTPNDFEAAQLAAQADYEARIRAALEPARTALALVAAAYRDAAGVLDDHGDSAVTEALGQQLCCNGHHCGCQGADVGEYLQHIIKQQTPADATSALAAIERAAYERGVRDAAKACDWGDIYGDNAVSCILALLTQEGR